MVKLEPMYLWPWQPWATAGAPAATRRIYMIVGFAVTMLLEWSRVCLDPATAH